MDEIKMRVSGVEKSFPGVKALSGIDFAVRKGTVHALCGENGAGKSTLMKIIMGLYQADKGQIYLDEKPVTIKNPIQAMEMGISMVAQELNYVPELSVEENLFLGRLPVLFTLDALDKDMYVSILKEPKNAILKQYKKLLALDEVDLRFDDSAYEAIAEEAIKRKTGARALRAIIEKFMLDIMYEIPKDDNIGEVVITKEYIEGTGGPVIMLRGQEVPRLQ